jgi:hypothetical protein
MGIGDWLSIGEIELWALGAAFIIFLHWAYLRAEKIGGRSAG